MVNQPHAPHFGPDGFQHPGREVVLPAKGRQVGKELTFGVFQLDEDGQEDPLVVPVPREEQPGQVAQVLDPGYLVVVEFYLGAYHVFIPAFSGQIWALLG